LILLMQRSTLLRSRKSAVMPDPAALELRALSGPFPPAVGRQAEEKSVDPLTGFDVPGESGAQHRRGPGRAAVRVPAHGASEYADYLVVPNVDALEAAPAAGSVGAERGFGSPATGTKVTGRTPVESTGVRSWTRPRSWSPAAVASTARRTSHSSRPSARPSAPRVPRWTPAGTRAPTGSARACPRSCTSPPASPARSSTAPVSDLEDDHGDQQVRRGPDLRPRRLRHRRRRLRRGPQLTEEIKSRKG
jgi:hypothetical protein